MTLTGKRTLLAALLLAVLALALPSLAQQSETVVDVLASDPDERFTTLISAVEAAGLAETLSGEGPFTVFAPTNDAFDAALEALGMSAEDLLADTDALTAILTYHVVPERLLFRRLISADSLTSVQGEEIPVLLADGVLTVAGAPVSGVDRLAGNGVVHIIDAVMLPPSLAETLMAGAQATETAEDADATPTEAPMAEATEMAMTAEATEMAMTAEATEMADAANTARLRVAHFAPDAPAVDVYLGGEPTGVAGLEYSLVTDWISLAPGAYEVAVAPAGTSVEEAVIGPVQLTLAAGSWTTVAAVGSLEGGTLTAAPIVEDFSPIEGENARVTVFHAIEGAPAVDITAGGGVLISELAFPGTQGDNDGAFSVEVPADTYDLQVVVSGTATVAEPAATPEAGATAEAAAPQVILSLPGTELEPQRHYFVAAVGTVDNPNVVIEVYDARPR